MFNRNLFLVSAVFLLIATVPVLAVITGADDADSNVASAVKPEETDGYYAFANQSVMELQPQAPNDDTNSSAGSNCPAATRQEVDRTNEPSGVFGRAMHSTRAFLGRLHSHKEVASSSAAGKSSREGFLWRLTHADLFHKQQLQPSAQTKGNAHQSVAMRSFLHRSVYQPVAGISASIAEAAIRGANINLHEVNGQIVATNAYVNDHLFVKYSDDAIVKCAGDSQISFANGDIFVSAAKDTLVAAGDAKVVIAESGIVSLIKRAGVLSIRNLCENHQGCVGVEVGGRLFPVRAGEEVLVSKSFDELAHSAKLDAVHRRNLATAEVPDGHVVMTCEYDVPSLFQNSVVLRQVAHSNNAIERSLFGKVLKMTACLQVVAGTDGFKAVD